MILVCVLNPLARQLEGNVSVPGIIMGSSVGMHPLWALLAILVAAAFYGLAGAVLRYPNRMLLFERWQKTSVMQVFAKGDPKVAASGELAGLRGSIGGEG